MRKTIIYLARTILVLFLLLNIMVIFHAYKLTHYYDRTDPDYISQNNSTTWGKAKQILFGTYAAKSENIAPDTTVQVVLLETEEKLVLEGWLLPARNAKGTVAMFHGHGGKKSSLLAEAAAFRQLGYNTLLVDFRAHGNSGGHTCTIGNEESEDVKLAYDYLVKNHEKNIVLYGISLGAATITKAIHDYKLQPQQVILEMPFASLSQAVEGRLKMMHLPPQPLGAMLTFWGGVEQGFWAFNLNPSEYVKDVQCPVLLQWGRNDARVAASETKEIFDNIPGPKRLVVYENSGHQSLYSNEPEKWLASVSAFLR